MSKKDKDCVTEKLCESRRETLNETINGLKKAIYVSSTAVAVVIVIVQFILTFWR